MHKAGITWFAPCQLSIVANQAAAKLTAGAAHDELPKDSADLALGRLDHLRNAKGGSPTAAIRDQMQRAMSAHAAVFRTDELMAEGKTKLAEIYARMKDISVTDRSLIWNSDLIETLELDNLISRPR